MCDDDVLTTDVESFSNHLNVDTGKIAEPANHVALFDARNTTGVLEKIARMDYGATKEAINTR
jgi:hypothetical protein